jgi:hypothetical protein
MPEPVGSNPEDVMMAQPIIMGKSESLGDCCSGTDRGAVVSKVYLVKTNQKVASKSAAVYVKFSKSG